MRQKRNSSNAMQRRNYPASLAGTSYRSTSCPGYTRTRHTGSGRPLSPGIACSLGSGR